MPPGVIGRRRAATVAASCLAGATLLGGCGSERGPLPKASAERGHDLIVENGCGTCHTIGGVERANGDVGPRLTDFKRKRRIAGRLPNTPDAVVRWLLDPPAVDPPTLMPDLDLTPEQARDIAAYLYTQ
jgi:cytochrome c